MDILLDLEHDQDAAIEDDIALMEAEISEDSDDSDDQNIEMD
jgi:hypothetical protein